MRTDPSNPSLQWRVRSPAEFGRAVAGVRAERELTQEQLAAELGVDRAYLARLEGGSSTLLLERALRALRRMGATVTVSLPENDGEAD